jgi:probable F420-dependent oxidoreductase
LSASFYVGAAWRPAPEVLQIAAIAEELGFDGMSFGEHVFVPAVRPLGYPYEADGRAPFKPTNPWLDALALIGAAAATTSRLRLTTGVCILPLRHPLLLARTVATIAAFAPGRIELGVGVGWMREEFEALGVEFAKRGALTDESIEVLRKLWRGGLVEREGPNYRLDPFYFEPHPAQQVPILVGGLSPAAIRRAARLGDGYIAMPDDPEILLTLARRIQVLRAGFGRQDHPFSLRTTRLEAMTPSRRLRRAVRGRIRHLSRAHPRNDRRGSRCARGVRRLGRRAASTFVAPRRHWLSAPRRCDRSGPAR